VRPDSAEALVIGYGNTLRRDDGAGPWVAAEIESRAWSGVRTMAVHQLAPEVAAELAAVRRVIFVDARVGPKSPPVEARRVEPRDVLPGLTHTSEPAALLQLAQDLYGRTPEAWLVTIAGEDFGVGEGMTEATLRHARSAVGWIERLLRQSDRIDEPRKSHDSPPAAGR
jgi:hydrogenase maturation protease